jgi:hypothetical protein
MAPGLIDEEREPLDISQAAHHIRITVEIAGFPSECADALINAGFDPQTVAAMFAHAAKVTQ